LHEGVTAEDIAKRLSAILIAFRVFFAGLIRPSGLEGQTGPNRSSRYYFSPQIEIKTSGNH
jgi:hypothetical protein